MKKRATSFRLSTEALEHLGAVQSLTGSTQAAIIEQALTFYRILYDRDSDFVRKVLQKQSVEGSG